MQPQLKPQSVPARQQHFRIRTNGSQRLIVRSCIEGEIVELLVERVHAHEAVLAARHERVAVGHERQRVDRTEMSYIEAWGAWHSRLDAGSLRERTLDVGKLVTVDEVEELGLKMPAGRGRLRDGHGVLTAAEHNVRTSRRDCRRVHRTVRREHLPTSTLFSGLHACA